jgi:hypothetical protein
MLLCRLNTVVSADNYMFYPDVTFICHSMLYFRSNVVSWKSWKLKAEMIRLLITAGVVPSLPILVSLMTDTVFL